MDRLQTVQLAQQSSSKACRHKVQGRSVSRRKECQNGALHLHGSGNDSLMIFISTVHSKCSFHLPMMPYRRQLGKSRSGASPQCPAIDANHGPVSHSRHVTADTIASSVALFNQSSQAAPGLAAAEQSRPRICITGASTIRAAPP